jgi:phospholipid/cholesterol/gamma-HCH transport system substrate-binding protein
MNQAQQTARIGLFFILGVALVWATFETLSGGSLFHAQGYRVTAAFDDLKELKQGDEVRMAGVRIGSVDQTELKGRQAEAVLLIDPGVKIASDATAQIDMSGLIGNNYIAIDLGTAGAPPLAPGAEIRTASTPDLNTIMSELGTLGQKLDGALSSLSVALNGKGPNGGLFQQLNSLIADNSGKISATLTNLQEITDKINRGQGTMGKLINDPDLHDQLLASVAQIKAAAAQARQFVASAQSIVNQVKSGQGALGTLVYDPQTAANIKVAVQNLREVSDKLAKGEGTLGKLINDDGLYVAAKGTLTKANRALDGLNDSGPISAVGVVANSLF